MKVKGSFMIVKKKGDGKDKSRREECWPCFCTVCELFEIFISLALLSLRK